MTVDLATWRKAGLLEPYYGVEWDQKKGYKPAYSIVMEYIDNLKENRDKGIGLVLAGPPGTGKTQLAHYVGGAALEMGMKVRFITLVGYQRRLQLQMDYMRLVENMKDPDAAEKWWQGKRYLQALRARTDLVILDDVGKEHKTATGFIEGQFDHLMRSRGNHGLPTIMTTNVQSEDWSEIYGPSMASWLKQIAHYVPVAAEDHRERR